MSDHFDPEVRKQGWYSGDSRKAAQGKANEAILVKLGQLPVPDLSGIEAVQMGHVMEPVIGRLAQSKLGIDLQKIEDAYAHKQHPWLRSHFDFVGVEDGKNILVEAKNYGSHQRSKFDVDAGIVPAADLAQVIHEAAVFDVSRVYLAVLFGGQEFVTIKFDITDAQKEELIQQMAVFWGHVQAGNPLPPEDPAQARVMYPVSEAQARMASKAVEEACLALRTTKAQIKALEAQEEALAALVQGYMQEHDTLVSVDGEVLATWKSAKTSAKFNADMFKQQYPDFYKQFVSEVPGSRRFLVKG